MNVSPRNPAGQSDVSNEVDTRPSRTRWVVLALMSLMYLIAYMDRGNISVAAPQIARQFGLSDTQMGLVFSAFVWTYAIGQIPGGWLGDRFGPKTVLTIIMIWWAVASGSTGLAAGFVSLLVARLILGLGEAGAFPVATRGMQLWFPKSERARVQGVTNGFSRVAVAITPLVAVSIMTAFGWRTIFYVFGCLGVVWAVGFYWIYRNRPEENKRVNRLELAHIRGVQADGTIAQIETGKRPKTPWKSILRSPNMWFLMAAYGCFFYGTYFFLSWYPTYLEVYRHFSLKSLGFVASIPLLVAFGGDLLGGSISDWVFQKTGKLKLARRIVAAPAMLLAGIFLIPTAVTRSPWTALLCLAVSFFFLDSALGPSWAVAMDIGGEFSGTVSSIMNSAGALGASASPIVFGFFVQKGSWVAPFFVTAGMLFTGALIWTFLIDPEKSVIGETRPAKAAADRKVQAESD